jgi:hypothetical protein
MAKRDPASVVLNIRREAEQRALHEALLVPWQRLAHGASAFAEWHMIILWVRVITETADHLPQTVRSELESRCPGFLEFHSRQASLPIWKSLEDWVNAHRFATPRAEGWFDALMYYAYEDLRTEQAWTTWERTRADWHHTAPVKWPALEQWTSDVLATHSLARPGTEKARAVHALGMVETPRLNAAIADLLEARALALWVDAVSEPGQPIQQTVSTELRNRVPGILPSDGPSPIWNRSLFSSLLRRGQASWRGAALSEAWYAVLRYKVVHHPRYQRFIYYNQRCHDEWDRVRPRPYVSFSEWLGAADGYCIQRES